MTSHHLVVGALVLAATFFLVLGTWAFLWPHNFYEVVAEYPPFNLHLFHDVGAFQLGFGASLLGALFWFNTVFVALLDASIGSVVHAISQLVDGDLGGDASGTWSLGAMAALLVLGTGPRLRSRPVNGEEH
jgi:hypothetical protein